MSGNNKRVSNKKMNKSKKQHVEEILPVIDDGYETPTNQPITVSPYITYAPTRPKNNKNFFEDNTKIIFPKI